MKKRWFALCMCIVMLAGILTSCGTNTGKIKFGAAGLGGTYRVFGDTFANLVTSKNKKYKMEVKTTAGSAANLRLLSDGYIQMAVAQTDLTNDAYERTGIFENEKQHGGYSAVAALYTEACQIVVKADSSINTVEDLQDKRVSVGEEESGTEQNAKQILAAYGLNDSLVEEVNLDSSNAAEELREGKIDAFFCTAGAVVVLMLGKFLKERVELLERFCIPAPVIGGVIFAIFTCLCYVTGIAEFSFDDILKEVCMVFFFTSVGFQANLKVLKSGGRALIVFLGLVITLILCQNFLAIGLAKLLHISPLVGLCTGSIPMIGGHGTAGAFGPVLEDFGVKGASTLCTAAATFGLIAGSVMGGPVGKRLIEKKNLLDTVVVEDDSLLIEDERKHERHASMYPAAVFQLIIAIGIGTIISKLLSLTGMTFPIYIGAMIAAACMRNIGEYSGKFTIYMGEINDIGGISLSLFLGIAMITLKLWQLADLALPLITLLAGQTILMFLYTYFVVFNVMGRDYDAAVLSSGVCGFGMGATPNAMANMQAVCEKYAPSVKAFLLVPLIGSLFADFLNSLAITFFINFL